MLPPWSKFSRCHDQFPVKFGLVDRHIRVHRDRSPSLVDFIYERMRLLSPILTHTYVYVYDVHVVQVGVAYFAIYEDKRAPLPFFVPCES